MDDLLQVFLVEAFEGLIECDADVDRFCEEPDDDEACANILQLVGSIRETSNFLGLPVLHVAAAAAVKVLSDLKSGDSATDTDAGEALRRAIVEIKTLIMQLRQSVAGADPIHEGQRQAEVPATDAVVGTTMSKPAGDISPPMSPTKVRAVSASAETDSADRRGTTPTIGPATATRPDSPPAAPQSLPVAAAPASAGTVRINAETLDDLLSTLRQLMASQTEMMQLMKGGDKAAIPATPTPPADPLVPAAPASAQPAPSPVSPVSPGPLGATTTPAVAAPATPAQIETAAEKVISLPTRGPAAAEAAASGIRAAPAPRPENVKLIMFQTLNGGTKAVRAELVDHIREINLKALDGARGLWVLRTDTRLIPLVPVDGSARLSADARMIAIMCCIDGAWMGLMVRGIIGTVESSLIMLSSGGRRNRIATTMINQESVDVIDPARCLGDAIDGRTPKSRSPEAPKVTRAAQPTAAQPTTVVPASDLFGHKPTR